MPRRIDIELTSARDDGTWTWRAAGAREPKGTVGSDVLPTEAKVGDVLKVDAEFFVDGIEITAVIPTKRAERKEPERLELLGSTRADEPLVTTTLTSRREDRGGRRDRPRRDGERRDGDRRGRERRDGDERARQPRRDGERPARRNRPEPPPVPTVERPKAKRLRAGRTHRSELLASLPEAERPVAEQLMAGGMPAVRQAIEKQNAERTAAGEPEISPRPLIELAEKLAGKVRAADWRDRAEAARKDLEQLDLRDLRSVVSAAGDAGKDPEARTLADELKAGLAARVDAEHALWLEELTATVEVGRVVRALRLSSRPPKAGAPLPTELAAALSAAAGEALSADATAERWVAVLDALAFAPVRDRVIPSSLPTDLHPDVRATIARLATRIPKVAHIFEIEPDPTAPRPKVERRRPAKKKAKPKDTDANPAPKAGRATEEGAAKRSAEPATEGPETTTPDAPVADAGADGTTDASVTEAPATEGPSAAAAEPEAPVAERSEAAVPEPVSEPEAPAADATDPDPTPVAETATAAAPEAADPGATPAAEPAEDPASAQT